MASVWLANILSMSKKNLDRIPMDYELFHTMDCNNLHSFTIQGNGFLNSSNYYRLKHRVLPLDG
ncbi:MAG: hypothetical protein RL257_703, partial [Actinomycetota bacterium]